MYTYVYNRNERVKNVVDKNVVNNIIFVDEGQTVIGLGLYSANLLNLGAAFQKL